MNEQERKDLESLKQTIEWEKNLKHDAEQRGDDGALMQHLRVIAHLEDLLKGLDN